MKVKKQKNDEILEESCSLVVYVGMLVQLGNDRLAVVNVARTSM